MNTILQLLTRTSGALAPLIARLTLAVVFFPHGAQKVLGWFGGYGFEGTMGFFTLSHSTGTVTRPWHRPSVAV